ncbi:MAG: bifunctional UDP-N-acetylglucosamine diphosphorylase/glucosamine-1-phosphate N-acetyltransferase GlmU [Chloroflexota bacterium]|nr:bifunctional UDP-N-acetylglucosamine diphosphorylase/glucosamine-1-phosphate N-acetyltransferase GlmU [Chloroflexota bacterium]
MFQLVLLASNRVSDLKASSPGVPVTSQSGIALVVLAAGRGTRMRSALPKPLHPVAGVPMVEWVLRAGAALMPDQVRVVVSPDLENLPTRLGLGSTVRAVVQETPRGTGDAVRIALASLDHVDWVVVLYADHPLLTGEVVKALLATAREGRALLALLTCHLPEPAMYGRIERDARGRPVRVIEWRDDEPSARRSGSEINSGMMALDARWGKGALARIQPSETTGELYLPDLLPLAVASEVEGEPWPVTTLAAGPEVAVGINDRIELSVADSRAREAIRRRHMSAGVTIVGPETVFIDEDVTIGPDTTVLPGTLLLGGTSIGSGCVIGPHAIIGDAHVGDRVLVNASTVRQSVIGSGSDVGPYAHLRAGTLVAEGAHIGNFVELKNSEVRQGAKVGHVSYLGDATVGARANIGAGTITANFDGFVKHRTEIGEDAFVGCDAQLIAPVRIGARARVGAGAVVTRDVPDGATVVGMPARIIRHEPGNVERQTVDSEEV